MLQEMQDSVLQLITKVSFSLDCMQRERECVCVFSHTFFWRLLTQQDASVAITEAVSLTDRDLTEAVRHQIKAATAIVEHIVRRPLLFLRQTLCLRAVELEHRCCSVCHCSRNLLFDRSLRGCDAH
jgi:hypothetical protein